jgi:hypothetical protein
MESGDNSYNIRDLSSMKRRGEYGSLKGQILRKSQNSVNL